MKTRAKRNFSPEFRLEAAQFMYHHENTHGELMAGKCCSILHQNPDGKLVLKESWQWFTGDQTTGTSELEEVVAS